MEIIHEMYILDDNISFEDNSYTPLTNKHECSKNEKANNFQFNTKPLICLIFSSFIILLLFLLLMKLTSIHNNIFLSRQEYLIDTHIHIDSNDSCIINKGYNYHDCVDSNNISLYNPYTKKRIYRISLHGDSLITNPNLYYNLSSNLLNRLKYTYPHLEFDIIVSANGAAKIHNIFDELNRKCLAYHPHSVIIFGDTDRPLFINNDIKGIQTYGETLINTIILLKDNVVNIAIAGPGLNGEYPDGQNRYDNQLNNYLQYNKNIALQYNISYINIRKAFFNKEKYNKGEYGLHHGANGQCGYLTIDGSHPSKLGSIILEDMFFKQLKLWYKDIMI